MARILRCIQTVAVEDGGPAYSTVESSRILAAQGHSVTILTLDSDESIKTNLPHGVQLVCVGPGLTKFGFSLRYVAWLRKNADRFDFATVHGIWRFCSLGFYLGTWRLGIAYFVMPHGSLDVWDRALKPLKFLLKRLYWTLIERHIYRLAVRCFFTAEVEQRRSTSDFPFGGISHSVISYGALDRGSYRLVAQGSDRVRICYLGRLHRKKGLEVLLDAFAVSFASEPDARLLIAGAGDPAYAQQLVQRGRALGIEDRVDWIGHVSGESKDTLLMNAGLFVLPSHQENFGLAVAESLSCGTPVAVSSQVNTASVVSGAGAGFVFERSVESLVEVFEHWKSKGYSDGECRARARHCFLRHMSMESFASEIASAGEEVLVARGLGVSA